VTQLLLWRHGETEWNAAERVQGHTDVELSEVGLAQATRTAARLAAIGPDLLVSSDLRRARATADALAALTGLDVTLDPRLRERYYGQWQGLPLTEVKRRWPAEYARWRAGQPVVGAGVEDFEDFAKRVGAGLHDVVAAAPGGTIVVATHGGTARIGTAQLLGWPESVARTLGGLGNCHWTELTFDAVRGWQLRAHNVR
jgi:probable phosphoglycerate mutase